MCNNPLRSNIEHCCKQHSTGRHSICRVTITQIHKHKIELGGTLYSLHLQSDRLGREAAAWNNEPLPSQGTHCKHTFHTAVQESVLFEQRSEHCGDLVPTRPVRQLSMCSTNERGVWIYPFHWKNLINQMGSFRNIHN